MSTMRAVTRDRYGSPSELRLVDVDRPTAEEGRVLVRVVAASINPYDLHSLTGLPWMLRLSEGLRRPSRTGMGVDLAGVVEAVGPGVGFVQPGDEVFGFGRGALAEFATAAQQELVPKPAGVSFAEAAGVPIAGLTALQAVRDKAGVEPGQHVLVNGAAGGVGTYAVQIAKSLGAHVTAVCSTRNVELVRGLGADDVVDYTRDDFTSRADAFDAIIDNVGNRSVGDIRRALRSDGIYVVVGGPDGGRLLGPLPSIVLPTLRFAVGSQRARFFIAGQSRDDLLEFAKLMETGAVRTVVDSTFALEGAAEAFRHLAEGHARGKVIVAVDASGAAAAD